jgi:hypothetical protein
VFDPLMLERIGRSLMAHFETGRTWCAVGRNATAPERSCSRSAIECRENKHRV